MYLYHRIRDLREDHDKTQRDVAKYLNMQLTVYQRYERGERELPLWAAIKLADYYRVSLGLSCGIHGLSGTISGVFRHISLIIGLGGCMGMGKKNGLTGVLLSFFSLWIA